MRNHCPGYTSPTGVTYGGPNQGHVVATGGVCLTCGTVVR